MADLPTIEFTAALTMAIRTWAWDLDVLLVCGLQDVVYVGRRRTLLTGQLPGRPCITGHQVDHAAVEMMSRRRRTMNVG